MTQVVIEKLDLRERDKAADVLVRSFYNTPNIAYCFPEKQRQKALTASFSISLKNALSYKSVWVARINGEIAGVAIWLPPGTSSMSVPRQIRLLPQVFQLFVAAPTSFQRLMSFGSSISRLHPHAPHWYLEVIGVSPHFQGQGLGTQLITSGLQQADRDGIACYLETDTRKNVQWYNKCGFNCLQEAVSIVKDGPRFWLMWRPPASSSHEHVN